ncbi:MAG: hypothetical protein VYC34_01145, partial [Planctomycetota bacterium]|nr:hypothetical protein [Planctomycetota bacterium]
MADEMVRSETDRPTREAPKPPDVKARVQGDRHWPAESAGKQHNEDRRLLAGPGSRTEEFFRALRILGETIRGFRALHFIGPCVTVFGSARFDEDHRYYKMAREVGRQLAQRG